MALTTEQSDVRFIAEWIEKQHVDPATGEWNPDKDEYCGLTCSTLEAAKDAAVRRSKRANAVEWCRVARERFLPELGIPKGQSAAWDTDTVWHGDWEGNWEEERYG